MAMASGRTPTKKSPKQIRISTQTEASVTEIPEQRKIHRNKHGSTKCLISIVVCLFTLLLVMGGINGLFVYNYYRTHQTKSQPSTTVAAHLNSSVNSTSGTLLSNGTSYLGGRSYPAAESPLDQLEVPEGFGIRIYARVKEARFLLALPGDFVLVSVPTEGKIKLLRPGADAGSLAIVTDYATGLRQPHDMVLYDDGNGKSYLYIAESHQIVRVPYNKGDRKIGKIEMIVPNLPGTQTYDGPYHHLKNIAIGKDTLYVSIGSESNADPEDLTRDPKRGAIYGYSLTGENRRLISEGIRNAAGLAFAPDTEDLWIVNNQRDDVKYPYRDDSGNYGQILDDYEDENPAEEFTKVEEGKNYGWPYCNPIPSDSMDDLDYVPDVDNNENETVVNCSTFRRVDKGIRPHYEPLGLTFWTGENVDEKYRGGALVAMHGGWGRYGSFYGNQVSFFPWIDGRPGAEVDLVTAWENATQRWGQPVDVAVLEDGSVLISDDTYGVIYKLYKNVE